MLALPLIAILSAAAVPPPTVEVAAGPRYEAGWFKRVWLGGQWREVWTTPVAAPVLDLHTFDGGLEANKRGGGTQTKNLHLRSANGRRWAFRSIDKDQLRALDESLQESKVGELFQDTTSTIHPFAPVVAASLLESAGILHATPFLFVMPDDPALGEFRDFAGVLGFLEERLEENLADVAKVETTTELFARLERRDDEQVDARDYLRARLCDVFIGDWDRHVSQWRWARFDQDGKRIWRPVPRDRDQVFARFQGILPSLGEYYTKQLAGFGDSYPDIEKLTFSGRFTDRRFLVPLSKADWEAETAALKARFTDEAISQAVQKLPPAIYAIGGAELERMLRARRDKLTEASRDFYRVLAKEVDVRATESSDRIEVSTHEDGAVEIAIAPSFHRTFSPDETNEIRLYTNGPASRVDQQGQADRGIGLRIVEPGPPGDGSPASLARRYEPFRDWGSDWLVFPQLGFDSTRGLVPGARLQLTQYAFGRDPFADQMQFAAAYSTGTNRPKLEYAAEVRTRSPLRAFFYAGYSGIDQLKYFGSGNETVRDASLTSGDFYNARQEQFTVHGVVELPIIGPLRSRAGVLFQHVSSVEDKGIVRELQPYGAHGMSLGSGEVGLLLDGLTGVADRQRGFKAQFTARHSPAIFSNGAAFTKLRGEAGAVVPLNVLTEVLLAMRVAGEKNFGTYPFFESAFLGGGTQPLALDPAGPIGSSILRGYDVNRFAGDSSVVGNAELRLPIGQYNAIVPAKYGIYGLADVGRVFVSGESSSKWHVGVGGGLWMTFFAAAPGFYLATTLNAAVVHSDEGTSFLISSGFGL